MKLKFLRQVRYLYTRSTRILLNPQQRNGVKNINYCYFFSPTLSDSRGAWFMLPMTGMLKCDAKFATNRASFPFLVCRIITVTLLSNTSEQNVFEISSKDKPWSRIVCRVILVKLLLWLRSSIFSSSDVSRWLLRSKKTPTFTFIRCVRLSAVETKLNVQKTRRKLLKIPLCLMSFIGDRSYAPARMCVTSNEWHSSAHARTKACVLIPLKPSSCF